jgi:hypothetical protein
MKLFLYISNPENFLRNPEGEGCYYLCHTKHMDDVWTFVQEIIVDETGINKDILIASATKDLDADIGRATAVIASLEARKAELLALPAPNNDNNDNDPPF